MSHDKQFNNSYSVSEYFLLNTANIVKRQLDQIELDTMLLRIHQIRGKLYKIKIIK